MQTDSTISISALVTRTAYRYPVAFSPLCFFILFLISASLSSADHKRFRVGALLFLSGDYAPLGQEIRRGIELGLEGANENIDVIFEDIGTLDRKRATAAAHKVLSVDKVDLVVTATASESEPIAPIFEKAGVPLLVLWDSTNALVSGRRYVFSNGFSTEAAGHMAARFTAAELKLKSVAVLTHLDAWSTTISRSFIEEFIKRGGNVTTHVEVAQDERDYRAVIGRLLAAKPEGIYFPLVANASLFLKQLRSLESTVALISADTMILPGEVEAAGSAADGVYYTAVFTDNEKELGSVYTKKYGEKPTDSFALSFGFDGIKLSIEALKRARGTSSNLAAALRQLLGEDGTANKIVRLYQIRGNDRIALPRLACAGAECL